MSATASGNGAGTKFVGQSMRRKEDPRLITGQGSYVDDISLPGQLWAAWVRSPEAHAKIVSIDTSAAKERPGVVAVYTNADLDMEAGLPMAWVPPGVEVNTPDHWVLAKDAVKHVGDPVALVVGTDRYGVVDAAEDVIVEYDPLPVVTDPEAAIAGGPLVHEHFGTNKVCDWSLGGGDLEAGFAEADVIIERRIVNHRMAGAAIEPRGVLAQFRAGEADRVELHPGPALPAAVFDDLRGDSRGPGSRGRPGGRGRVRLQAEHLCRGDRPCVGGDEAAASGQVDRDALRGHDGHPPRARPDQLREDRRQA